MAESTDPKLMIAQATPLVPRAVEQALDAAGSVVEDIDALIKDVDSLEPVDANAATASVDDLTRQSRAINATALSAAHPSPTAAPQAPKPVSPSANAAALNQADQALAKDLDAMLGGGDFESIDAVLDGVFEEQAVLVQQAEHSKAKTPRQMEIESAASRDTDQVHQVQPTTRAAESAASIATATAPIAEPVQPPRAEFAAPVSAVEIMAAPSSVAAVTPVVPAPVVVATAIAAPVAMASTATQPAIVVAESAGAISEPQPAAASSAQHQKIQFKVSLSAITAPLRQVVFQVLTLLNLPMKFVPTKLKPAMDVVALSLVLWVPLAFILPPKMAAWNAARAAAAHTTSAVHEQSSNAAEADKAHKAPAEDHGGGGSGGGGGHDAPKNTDGGH